jgi:hypothetical protein
VRIAVATRAPAILKKLGLIGVTLLRQASLLACQPASLLAR